MSMLLASGMYLIVLFFLTRYFPFANLSFIMNVGCILLFIYGLVEGFKSKLFLILAIHITLVAIYTTLFKSNDYINISRFYIIFLLLYCAHFITISENTIKKYSFLIVMLHAVIIISLWLYFTIIYPGGDRGYFILRHYFLENGFGDIYTHGYFYKVQLKGNAILPFFYMMSFYFYRYFNNTKYLYVSALLLASVIFCGNFMFIFSIAVYHLILMFLYIKNTNNNFYNSLLKMFIIFLFMVSFPFLITKIIDVIEFKSKAGALSSMGIRYDQAFVLFKDMLNSKLVFLLGNGLGYTLNVITESRNYVGKIYYELQVLYFANQLGFINFIISFLGMIFLFFNKVKSIELRIIYFCYVLYAISNPYILDTNQFVVIIFLISTQRIILKHQKSENFVNER